MTSVEYKKAEAYTYFITLVESYLVQAQTHVCLMNSSPSLWPQRAEVDSQTFVDSDQAEA